MSTFLAMKRAVLAGVAGAALSVALAGAAQAKAAQCPDWQLGGAPVSVNAAMGGSTQQLPIQAGGAVDLEQCQSLTDAHALGHTTAAPSFTVSYDAQGGNQDLVFRVQSNCDTTLLINDPATQWQFNDDSNGTLNPRIRIPAAASGRYDVWVGSYDTQSCPATLTVESSAHQQAVCPDWSMGGQQLSLATGQAQALPVVAGGTVSLFDNQCNIPAHGYVAQAPDFSMVLDTQTQVTTLDLSVQANCDTVLLVNDPGTQWQFNDDSNGTQPRIEITDAQPGRYDIWVGTYGSGTCPATLNVAATSPQAQQPQAPVTK